MSRYSRTSPLIPSQAPGRHSKNAVHGRTNFVAHVGEKFAFRIRLALSAASFA